MSHSQCEVVSPNQPDTHTALPDLEPGNCQPSTPTSDESSVPISDQPSISTPTSKEQEISNQNEKTEADIESLESEELSIPKKKKLLEENTYDRIYSSFVKGAGEQCT